MGIPRFVAVLLCNIVVKSLRYTYVLGYVVMMWFTNMCTLVLYLYGEVAHKSYGTVSAKMSDFYNIIML